MRIEIIEPHGMCAGVNAAIAKALMMTEEDFRTNTVFYCYPPSMNQPTIPLLVRDAHLAQGIPALTPAAGFYSVQLEHDSEFATPYSALVDATFCQCAEFYERYDGERVNHTFDKSKCWVIRSRCKIDGCGCLASANYSVAKFLGISGSAELKVGFCFLGAFNPTPNDTNLEDIEVAKRAREFVRQCEPPPSSK